MIRFLISVMPHSQKGSYLTDLGPSHIPPTGYLNHPEYDPNSIQFEFLKPLVQRVGESLSSLLLSCDLIKTKMLVWVRSRCSGIFRDTGRMREESFRYQIGGTESGP